MDTKTLPTANLPGFVNPLTGQHVTPGKILGYRRNGQPIRVIAGGSGEGGDTGTDGGDGGTDGDQDGGNAGQDDAGSKKPDIKGELDPDRAARAIAAAREGEKKAKAEKKAAEERVAAILKAAGLTPDGNTDPAEQLKAAAAERDKAIADLAEARTENALLRLAGKAGGDADALRDSLTFKRQLAELDPSAADFDDKVTAAIKAAVKANPKLAASPAGQGPGKQGADHNGGGSQKSKPKTLHDAVAAKLGG